MSIERALGEERTTEIPAGTIVYRESGDPNGPPVLFLHGLLVNGDVWRGVAPRVAERGYRCLVPDWPLGSHARPMRAGADLAPHGLARIVADFVEATRTGPVTLVANDTGGAIAQMVATRHPERLARLARVHPRGPARASRRDPARASRRDRERGVAPDLRRPIGLVPFVVARRPA